MKAQLTKTLVKRLSESPPEKELLITDLQVPGLCLRARPGATPSYLFRYNRRGKLRKIHIGLSSSITPEQARAVAQKLRASIAMGEDPKSERQKMRERPTMGEFAERYMREHAQAHKKPRSVEGDRRTWDRDILPKWRDRLVDSITKEDVMRLKAEYAATSKSKANAAIALLSKAFNLAEDWGLRPQKSNPCYRVGKFLIEPRETILSEEQLQRFERALQKHDAKSPGHTALFRLLLLTGARLNEIAKARLENFDRDRMVLKLPDSKTGRDEVQLTQAAIEIIDAIPRAKGNPWLVPLHPEGGPARNPYNRWRMILRDAGLSGVRIHDLRHTFGSYSHRSGATQKTVAKLLRHRVMATTERYIKGFDKDRQDAASKTVDAILGLMRPSAASSHPEGSAQPGADGSLDSQ